MVSADSSSAVCIDTQLLRAVHQAAAVLPGCDSAACSASNYRAGETSEAWCVHQQLVNGSSYHVSQDALYQL